MIKECEICAKAFKPRSDQLKKGQGRFCSHKCSGIFHKGCKNGHWKEKTEKICITCGKKIIVNPSVLKYNPTKFCSKKCYGASLKISKRKDVLVKCGVCGKEFITSPWYVKNGFSKYCSLHCMGIGRHGDKSSSWKGGVSTFNELIRASKKYSKWRKAVYVRDEFRCVGCGYVGKKLQAHHIKSFANYPEKRFSIENGETVCVSCHKKRHIRKDRRMTK